MSKLRYVKLSNDWEALAPISTSTISQKFMSLRVTECGFSGKQGELGMNIRFSDGSYIIIEPKPNGPTIGLLEIKY